MWEQTLEVRTGLSNSAAHDKEKRWWVHPLLWGTCTVGGVHAVLGGALSPPREAGRHVVTPRLTPTQVAHGGRSGSWQVALTKPQLPRSLMGGPGRCRSDGDS